MRRHDLGRLCRYRITLRCLETGLFQDSVQFCSGLVDLVVCVGHHGGGGHRLAAAGERFVGLVAEDFAEVSDRGAGLGERQRLRGLSANPAMVAAGSSRAEALGSARLLVAITTRPAIGRTGPMPLTSRWSHHSGKRHYARLPLPIAASPRYSRRYRSAPSQWCWRCRG